MLLVGRGLGDSKGIWHVISSATTVFLAHMTAWRQYTVSKSGALLLSQEGCSVETRGQGIPCNCCIVPDLSGQHGDNVRSLVRNTVVLQCFDAVGWVTGRASCLKRFCHNNSQKFTIEVRGSLE